MNKQQQQKYKKWCQKQKYSLAFLMGTTSIGFVTSILASTTGGDRVSTSSPPVAVAGMAYLLPSFVAAVNMVVDMSSFDEMNREVSSRQVALKDPSAGVDYPTWTIIDHVRRESYTSSGPTYYHQGGSNKKFTTNNSVKCCNSYSPSSFLLGSAIDSRRV
jgi:hypothetical protein